MKLLCLILLLLACTPANWTVDLGVDVVRNPVSTIGVSYPVKGVSVSAGAWVSLEAVGPYLSLGYSWAAFQ